MRSVLSRRRKQAEEKTGSEKGKDMLCWLPFCVTHLRLYCGGCDAIQNSHPPVQLQECPGKKLMLHELKAIAARQRQHFHVLQAASASLHTNR
jgi:hypothetical protein